MKESQKKVEPSPSPSHRRFLRPQILAPASFKPYRSDRAASASAAAAAAAAAGDVALDLSGLREALPPIAGDVALDLSGLRGALPPIAGEVRHPPQRRGRRARHSEAYAVALILCMCLSGHQRCAAKEPAEPKVVDESSGSGRGDSPMLRRKDRRKISSIAPPSEEGRCISSCDAPPPQLSGEERMGGQME